MKRCRGTDAFCQQLLDAKAVTVDAPNGVAYSTRPYPGMNPGGPVGHLKRSTGYIVGTFHLNGERKQVAMHRLIWIATNGPIPDGLMLDHKNRNRSDNRIINLRLVTAAGNAKNRRSFVGRAGTRAGLSEATLDAIQNSPGNYADKARLFGISKSLVGHICRGRKPISFSVSQVQEETIYHALRIATENGADSVSDALMRVCEAFLYSAKIATTQSVS
jgi:hypothetical protein